MNEPPATPSDVESDDPDVLPCYRHADRLTALACSSCERPICTECAVQAAVGMKCPECGRISRSARATVPVTRIMRAALVAMSAAVVFGFLLAVLRVPFVGIILAYIAGMGVGALARTASGGFRDAVVARVAAAAAGGGVLLPYALDVLGRGGQVSAVHAWGLIGALVAAYSAYNRVSS